MATLNWFNYDPSFLEANEIQYDLSVRGIVGLSSRRAETVALRTYLQKESSGEYDLPNKNLNEPKNEMQEALVALESITNSICNIKPSTKLGIFELTRARIAHWLNRLKSLNSLDEKILKIIDEFQAQLEIVEVEHIHLVNSDDNSGAVGGNLISNPNQGSQRLIDMDVPTSQSSLPTTLNKFGRGRGLNLINGSRNNLNMNPNNVDVDLGSFKLKENNNRTNHNNPVLSGQNQNVNSNNNSLNNSASVSEVDELFTRLNLNNNRKIHMHRWNISFSGNGHGLSLNEFLTRINIYARAEKVPESQMLANIHLLLKDKAEHWYWGNINEFYSWRTFVEAIKKEFLPQNYDFFVREEIQNRIQGQNESFSSFITDMKILFQRVDPPLDERYKLYIVRRNMLTDYGAFLTINKIRTLNDLVDICRGLDESKMMAERRKISQPYSNISLVEPSCYPRNNYVRNFPQNRKVVMTPQVNYIESDQNVANNPNSYSYDGNMISNGPFSAQQSSFLINSCQGNSVLYFPSTTNPEEIVRNSEYSPGQFSELSQFQNISNNHPVGNSICEINQQPRVNPNFPKSDKSNLVCFNCKHRGHVHHDCLVPRNRIFCYSCGKDGFRASNCPTCARRHKSEINSSGNDKNRKPSLTQGNSQQGGR